MSYDVAFKVKVEGVNAYVEVGDCNANITWNVRDIIRTSTGLPWKNEENNGQKVGENGIAISSEKSELDDLF